MNKITIILSKTEIGAKAKDLIDINEIDKYIRQRILRYRIRSNVEIYEDRFRVYFTLSAENRIIILPSSLDNIKEMSGCKNIFLEVNDK